METRSKKKVSFSLAFTKLFKKKKKKKEWHGCENIYR